MFLFRTLLEWKLNMKSLLSSQCVYRKLVDFLVVQQNGKI